MPANSKLTEYIISELKNLIQNPKTPARVKLGALQELKVLRPTMKRDDRPTPDRRLRKLLGQVDRPQNGQSKPKQKYEVDRSLLGLSDD